MNNIPQKSELNEEMVGGNTVGTWVVTLRGPTEC